MSTIRNTANGKDSDYTDFSGSTYVFYHANCLDGIVAASLAVRGLDVDEDARVYPRPVRYGDLDFIKSISKRSVIYFVDFSLPPKELDKLIEECDPVSVTVIDHHVTFLTQVAAELGIGLLNPLADHRTRVELILGVDGESGASLCMRHWYDSLNLTLEEEQLVALTRTFDLWLHDGKTDHDASYLAAYMSLVIAKTKTTPETDYNIRSRGIGVPLSVALAIGKDEQIKLEVEADEALDYSGVGVNLPGNRRLLVVNAEASLFPTICDRYKKEVDFFLFWRHNTANRQYSQKHGFKFSLRAGRDTEMDLSVLAARLDAEGKGGGHKDAAGFSSGVAWDNLLIEEFGKDITYQPFKMLHGWWLKQDKARRDVEAAHILATSGPNL